MVKNGKRRNIVLKILLGRRIMLFVRFDCGVQVQKITKSNIQLEAWFKVFIRSRKIRKEQS